MTPRERPILFDGESVRAILAGTKTQTRRIVKPQPIDRDAIIEISPGEFEVGRLRDSENAWRDIKCPKGIIGDHLWVRENLLWESYASKGISDLIYQADKKDVETEIPEKWQPPHMGAHEHLEEGTNIPGGSFPWSDGIVPSIFMPRWASRIDLEITNVRIERVQDIDKIDSQGQHLVSADAMAEGCRCPNPTAKFMERWNHFHGHSAWDRNDWVWVIEFRRIRP